MVSNELKSVVAQYCPGYEPHYAHPLMQMSTMAGSCNNCSSFTKGKCVKNLLGEMSEKLSKN